MALWLTKNEIMARPTSGSGWDAVKNAAGQTWGPADVSDQESTHNVNTLAGAYVAVRQNDGAMRRKVQNALAAVVGTEEGGQVLSLGRKLAAYLIAADTIAYRDQEFVSWVGTLRTVELVNQASGEKETTSTMIDRHETRANNWGACCGMSRVAANLYLGDKDDLARAVQVWKGWLGDRASWGEPPHNFFFGTAGTSWCHDRDAPVPVNPKGASRDGHSLDGCLPADQNRTGPYAWPPPCGNYPHGVAGFVLVTIEMLRRNGFAQCHTWQDAAPRRILEWLEKTNCPATGNDTWQQPLARKIYPKIVLAGGNPKARGPNMAWCHWTHG